MIELKREKIKMEIEKAIMGRILLVGNGESDDFWKHPRFKTLKKKLEEDK